MGPYERHTVYMNDISHLSYAERQERIAQRAARYVEEYPQLTSREDKGRLSGTGLAAKNIRKLLKAAFPKVAFKVRADSYASGSAVYVHWTQWEGGPDRREIQASIERFESQKGQDQYENTIYDTNWENDAWRKAFGGASHVVCQPRQPTDEEQAKRQRDELDASVGLGGVTRARVRM